MKLIRTLNKKQIFELTFSAIVVILFIVKGCTNLSDPKNNTTPQQGEATSPIQATGQPSLPADAQSGTADTMLLASQVSRDALLSPSPHPRSLYGKAPHRIYGVTSYGKAFPDMNDVQLVSARYHGIKPQTTRKAVANLCGSKLVNIKHSPYYAVAKLTNSQPYLVPRAQVLLNRIGRNFIDSLLIKHLPPALITVSSVTRSLEDINNLQTHNINAVESSCHSYGTTFDISYRNFQPLTTLRGRPLRLVRDDTLKWVLSEVLNDLRRLGTCHIKHENKQGCFHITVR